MKHLFANIDLSGYTKKVITIKKVNINRFTLAFLVSILLHFLLLNIGAGKPGYEYCFSPKTKTIQIKVVHKSKKSEKVSPSKKTAYVKKISKKEKKIPPVLEKKLHKQSIENQEEKNPPSLDKNQGSQSLIPLFAEAIPIYKQNAAPTYPFIAKQKGFQGTVILEVLVTKEGRADKIRILSTSGYTVLDKAAQECVKNWLFLPALSGGSKVDMWVKVPITFELH